MSQHATQMGWSNLGNDGPLANYIALDFTEHVKETRIMLGYDFFNFVVDVGSAIGLWIGLSVMGMFDVFVSVVIWSRNNFKI